MGTGEKSTIYIDGRPVWEIGNAEVEPAETETGPLSLVAESAKAELQAQAYNSEKIAELLRWFNTSLIRVVRRATERALLYVETDPKVKHYFKNCKKLRVRKKYRNRMQGNLYAMVEAIAAQEEADE